MVPFETTDSTDAPEYITEWETESPSMQTWETVVVGTKTVRQIMYIDRMNVLGTYKECKKYQQHHRAALVTILTYYGVEDIDLTVSSDQDGVYCL